MMPVLHYYPVSAPCRAVLLLGRMLNLDFDLRLVNILEGEQMKPEFLEVSMLTTETHCQRIKLNAFIPVKSAAFGSNT